MSDPMEVKLVTHTSMAEGPAGEAEIEHDVFRVYVHSEGLAHRNKDKKLMVGYIGKQAGANMMPTNEFYSFPYPQQQWIAEQAKLLHGNASTNPHIDVPPPEPEAWDDEVDDDDVDDTDVVPE